MIELLWIILACTVCFTYAAPFDNEQNTHSRDCDEPELVFNGAALLNGKKNKQDRYEELTEVKYTCKPGYHMIQLMPVGNTRICKNGTWGPPAPQCSPANNDHVTGCPHPEPVANGHFYPEIPAKKYEIGDKVDYECKVGYSLVGLPSRKCDPTGQWFPRKVPFCTPPHISEVDARTACGNPPSLPHVTTKVVRGKRTSNAFKHSTAIEVMCESGFRDTKTPCVPTLLRCDDGEWRGHLPDCVAVESCLPPPSIPNGVVTFPMYNDDYRISSRISYICLPGFVMTPVYHTPVSFKCQDTGCWEPNASPPSCQPEPLFGSGVRLGSYDNYLQVNPASMVLFLVFAMFGMSSVMVAVCGLSMCRQRYLYLRQRRRISRENNRITGSPVGPSTPFIRPSPIGRAALIAFADYDQSNLPTYDDVLRQDQGNILISPTEHLSNISATETPTVENDLQNETTVTTTLTTTTLPQNTEPSLQMRVDLQSSPLRETVRNLESVPVHKELTETNTATNTNEPEPSTCVEHYGPSDDENARSDGEIEET